MHNQFIPDDRRKVQHSSLIDLRDLFPGRDMAGADEAMIQLAGLIEMWSFAHQTRPIRVQWLNILERDENPDGTRGQLRFIPLVKDPKIK